MEEEDDLINMFYRRADDIIKSRNEDYEKFQLQALEEETAKKKEKEYTDLLGKIKETMKRKTPANSKKGKRKSKKAKPEIEIMEEEPKSPPVTRRSTRKTRLAAKKATAFDEFKEPSPIKLPMTAKKRLKELKLRTDRETAQFEEEVRRTLSICDNDFLEASETISPLEVNAASVTLKIRYLGDVTKIEVKEDEKFSSVYSKAAELYNLKASEILLCLEDRNIHLDDTPLGLNLQFCDVVDCIPYKPSDMDEKDADPNQLIVKFQSAGSKVKTEMSIHQLEPFSNVVDRYAELFQIPKEDLRFEFDGETIDGSETPEDLEMESGSCIDVKVVKPVEDDVVDLSKNDSDHYPKIEMIEICVLD